MNKKLLTELYGFGVLLWSLALAAWWLGTSTIRFDTPYSTVVEDRQGQLLSASIAADEQWRFPEPDSLPDRYVKALLTFEDQRFFTHNGVDPWAMIRALWQNLRSGSIESGGSTLTMQVIRLSRGQQPRTLQEKFIEVLGAWRLEATHSKAEILKMYAAHAPFGGNVVGLEAASWRYFERAPTHLSWAEAACLAVLPNAPALLHPGRNQGPLLRKRDRLLDRLMTDGYLSGMDLEASQLEPLPNKPKPLPQLSYHLMASLKQRAGIQYRFSTSLDKSWQEQVNAIVQRHHKRMTAQEVYNMAAVVAEVSTGDVLAYVGNVWQPDLSHESAVDVMRAPRSSGSILKPFLFAHAMEDGLCTSNQLLPDVPVYYGSFTPENYHHSYDGAVPVHDALARSLNVPAVLLLQQYGVPRLKDKLKSMGMTTLFRPAEEYGLSLILGGAEVSLWDVTGMYRGMAHALQTFVRTGQYPARPYRGLAIQQRSPESDNGRWESQLSAGGIYAVFDMMTQVKRPAEERAWQHFSSGRKMAWKTGTSYGHRDAWAVGVTPTYVIGVWVGNADGEGRPGLTGSDAAAPVLFDIASLLPGEPWFQAPEDDRLQLSICRESGYRSGRYCPITDTLPMPLAVQNAPNCPYHRQIWVNAAGQQVHADCYPIHAAVTDTIFVLPPHMAQFFSSRHADYDGDRPWSTDCQTGDGYSMRLVYPQPGASLYLPRDITGDQQPAVLEAVHAREEARLYWYLNERFLGATTTFHQMSVQPEAGWHTLTLVDDRGKRWENSFQVYREE